MTSKQECSETQTEGGGSAGSWYGLKLLLHRSGQRGREWRPRGKTEVAGREDAAALWADKLSGDVNDSLYGISENLKCA